jgi:hypothetical protein
MANAAMGEFGVHADGVDHRHRLDAAEVAEVTRAIRIRPPRSGAP